MGRSGYSDDCMGRELNLWRGAVASALRGRRGQAFLREMRDALLALTERRLISGALVVGGECCGLGAVAIARGVDVAGLDPYEDRRAVAETFGIAEAMAAEVMFMNDEANPLPESPEKRWERILLWVESEIQRARD